MKRSFVVILMLITLICLPACSIPEAPPTETPTAEASVPPTAQTTQTPAPTAEPSPSPSTEQTPYGEEPDHAGSGDMPFDIYQHTALADLNMDGTCEQLKFTAGKKSSELQINGETFTIDLDGQAQLFAVTDIDVSDNILELAFTDKYSSELADTEFPFTYLYWWNGTELKKMGGLMDVKFDGAWRNTFDPAKHFDARGMVMCLTRTQNFSDVWYTGHYKPDVAARKLKEDLYAAPVLYKQEPLTLKHYMLLLKKIDNKYFDSSYAVIWDYASDSGGYGSRPREYSDEAVAFIPQAGEKLTIVKVYGKKWFKLKASDGKQGWLKCEDSKVFDYWKVMQYKAEDLFDGIVIAG